MTKPIATFYIFALALNAQISTSEAKVSKANIQIAKAAIDKKNKKILAQPKKLSKIPSKKDIPTSDELWTGNNPEMCMDKTWMGYNLESKTPSKENKIAALLFQGMDYFGVYIDSVRVKEVKTKSVAEAITAMTDQTLRYNGTLDVVEKDDKFCLSVNKGVYPFTKEIKVRKYVRVTKSTNPDNPSQTVDKITLCQKAEGNEIGTISDFGSSHSDSIKSLDDCFGYVIDELSNDKENEPVPPTITIKEENAAPGN